MVIDFPYLANDNGYYFWDLSTFSISSFATFTHKVQINEKKKREFDSPSVLVKDRLWYGET